MVVAIDACNGPARGRIVIEAKDRRLSAPRALKELDDAMAERSADFAVLVVPTEDEVPAKMEPLREYNRDKLIVALDPESGSLALEVGYRLARARVLMKRSDADGDRRRRGGRHRRAGARRPGGGAQGQAAAHRGEDEHRQGL